jgi:hypothetical protein
MTFGPGPSIGSDTHTAESEARAARYAALHGGEDGQAPPPKRGLRGLFERLRAKLRRD